MKFHILMALALPNRSIIWGKREHKGQTHIANKRGMADLTNTYKYALYLDSKDINSIQILEKWFRFGFFDKEQAVIIFRYYPKTIFTFPKELTERGFNYIGYNKFFSIALGKLPAVFYPFNTNTNPVLIKQRQTKHIFIGHGESDKEASINPMIRMYDLIFSSGPSSTSRYIENNIINQEDCTKRAFEIGMPYIDDQFKNNDIQKNSGLAIYCPTWEGANKNQQYSSLKSETSKAILEAALQEFENLFFMPHPSTGTKNKTYLNDLTTIVRLYSQHPNFTFIANSEAQKRIARKFNISYIEQTDLEWHLISTCITDISSMISTASYFKCKVICMSNSMNNSERLSEYIDEYICTNSTDAIKKNISKAFKVSIKKHTKIHNINTEKRIFTSNSNFFEYLYYQYVKAPN